MANCFSLFKHVARRACSRAAEIAGINKAISMPMMVMTTSNSTSVNAHRRPPNSSVFLLPFHVPDSFDRQGSHAADRCRCGVHLDNERRPRKSLWRPHSLPIGIVSNSEGKIQRFPQKFFVGLEFFPIFPDNRP